MSPRWGPERAEVIRVLHEQIRRARQRLDALAATADAEEASFEARDQADLDHAELRDELEFMDRIEKMLTGDDDPGNDVRLMQDALDMLRRDVER